MVSAKVTQIDQSVITVEQLLAENRALRQALSRVQGVPAGEVRLSDNGYWNSQAPIVQGLMSMIHIAHKAMHFLAYRPRRCVQVRFDLVDEEAVSGDSAAASAPADAAAQQPAGRSVTTAPAPKEVTLEVIEGAISWPQPQEEAFWERPPQSEAVSLGEFSERLVGELSCHCLSLLY